MPPKLKDPDPPTKYKFFEPLQEKYDCGDPRILQSLPLYKGVPPDADDEDAIAVADDGERFCSLGQAYQHAVIEVNTLTSRLDVAVRHNDYKILKVGNSPSIQIWDHSGDPAATPGRLIVELEGKYEDADFKTWDAEQERRWLTLIVAIANARPTVPYNVYTRFIQPPVDLGFTLIFTPSDTPALFTIDQLVDTFGDAFADRNLSLPKYKYRFLPWDKAIRHQPPLKMVGSHPFFFYHTWMTPDDFKNIWVDKGTPDLMRPWPLDQGVADSLDFALHNRQFGERGGPVTSVRMSHFKAKAAVGMRSKYPGQATVMGGSATEVAKVIWDPNTLKPKGRPTDAEWLHRNAFHFGGTEDVVDLASSQIRENLVFGTGESNTHMIRAENAITQLLAVDALASHDEMRSGTLMTINDWDTPVQHLMSTGERTPGIQIPDWVTKEEYMWLSLQLKYVWTMTCPDLGNSTFNAAVDIDPFSRYIPMRVETRLDDALINAIRNQYAPVVPPTSANNPIVFMMRSGRPLSTPPTVKADPENTHAWQAIEAKASSVNIRGVDLRNPKASQSSPASDVQWKSRGASVAIPISATHESLPPSDGFVLEGDISLFGIPTLTAQLEMWHGPPPAEIKVRPDEAPSIQRATIVGDFHLSSIIPALEGSAFDHIIFRNVIFYHQNYLFDKSKSLGWHLNADWVIDESCGALHDILSRILNVKEPILSVHAGLGSKGGWNQSLSLHSFTLDGIFSGLTITPVEGVHFTSIGVCLFGIRALRYTPQPHSVLEYGFGVFGRMNLDVPGSTVPLELNYEIREFGGMLQIAADVSGDIWHDPLGAKGLVLRNVSFSSTFATKSPWKSLAFDVSASLSYKYIQAHFIGSFAIGGQFALSATLLKFDMSTISDLFEYISHSGITIPDVDIEIGSATISIASQKGLEVNLHNIIIAGHTAVNATLAIGPTSVLIRGDLTSEAVEFGDVQVKKAFFQILLESSSASNGKRVDVVIGGEVKFADLTFDAAAHIYPAVEEAKGTEWTILAALTVDDDALALSKIAPEVKNTPFDLTLTNVVFVAASKDDPSLGQMITSGYEFHEGVQICATLSEIAELNSLMRHPVPGLVLSARWSKAAGFDLEIILPTLTTLSLGNGISTTPFKLLVQTSPVQLALSAGLSVPVAHSPTPLLFTFVLGINLVGATATGEMAGWWVNPFGISEKVKIGPNLALSIEIIFAQFVSTGTPSGFGVIGGLMIGKTQAQLALNVSEDPLREVLFAEVDALNLKDLVSFANDLTGSAIPDPPSDLLEFEKLKLYICPAGVTIGMVTYPQGFSFMADMTVFSRRADIACTVGGDQIVIKGGIDNFELGPLSVRGTDGPRAVIDCVLGASEQHVLVNGIITFFDARVAVHICVRILPSPIFVFNTLVSFTDDLKFQLNAELVGALSFGSISNADFTFDALLEQNILQYINEQLILQFDKARQAADEGINIAQKSLDEAGRAFDAGIAKAQAEVDTTNASWSKKSSAVTTESRRVINAYNADIAGLQHDIENAQAQYNQALTTARNDVEAANQARAHALADAQHDIDNSQRKMANDIANAQRAIDGAVANMSRQFGSANAAIRSAREKVESLQNQINNVNSNIRQCNDAPGYQFWKKAELVGLYAEVGALEASKAIADSVLQAAEAVLTSGNYLAAGTAVKTTQFALEQAQNGGNAGLAAAKLALQSADLTSRNALNAAEGALRLVKTGGSFVALQGAIEALEVYKQANKAALDAAVDALDELSRCAEFVAYESAKAALLAAKDATPLDAVKEALKFARHAEEEALAVGKWVVERGMNVCDIRVVRLSGKLREIVGADGHVAKPLTAHVEGVVLDKVISLDCEFTPIRTADFITSIFKRLWNEVEDILGV